MLTNSIRKYFGIKQIDKSWKKLTVKDLWQGHVLVDKKNVIQKLIYPVPTDDDFSYREVDYNISLSRELKIIGKKGKVQPLTAANLLKIKPEGKELSVEKTTCQLINHVNGLALFSEYKLKWRAAKDVIEFLKQYTVKPSPFFKKELDVFLNREKVVNQKPKQGDIFRVKLAGNQFAYGRVIANLAKFLTHDTGVVSKWELDWRGRSVFNEVLINQLLVDYFQLITDNPYLKYDDLKKKKRTPATCIIDLNVKHENYTIVDQVPVAANSFDLPMGIDTHYQYLPVCHIFKWGAGAVAFAPDKKVEQEKDLLVKKDLRYRNDFGNQSTEQYIRSCIKGKPDYAYLWNRGDLRYTEYSALRKQISKRLGFDINSFDYDAFAKKFGLMDRAAILAFTK